MERQTVAAFANRYRGKWTIVGKGTTRFEWPNLSEVDGPIIFINDAIAYGGHAVNATAKFFFAHDQKMKCWLPGLDASAVLPEARGKDGGGGRPMICVDDLDPSKPPAGVVTYGWDGWHTDEQIDAFTRESAAADGRLLLNSGTIHSAIWFAWLAGANEIDFIGCDGWGKGYDPRTKNASGSEPMGVFGKIRRVQDDLCRRLGIVTNYRNEATIEPRIPWILWFVWLGPMEIPEWATSNINAFAVNNPTFKVRVVREVPDEMPEDLKRIAADAEQLCMRSDVVRYWLLHEYGGLYFDVDMIPLRKIAPLTRFDSWLWRQHDARVTCSALGSVPGSPIFRQILDAVREADQTSGGNGTRIRTIFGPKMLTNLFADVNPDSGVGVGVHILPQHYFGQLIDGKEAGRFLNAGPEDRIKILQETSGRRSDASRPYAVHMWGVDASSKRKPFGRADALAYRIKREFGDQPVHGVECGVLSGRMSEAVLTACPNLTLDMVDIWAEFAEDHPYRLSGDTAAQRDAGRIANDMEHAQRRTLFAEDRRTLIRSDSVAFAESIPDRSLDFVFVDADHTLEGVRRDLRAFWPKIRAGGFLAGHDIDNPAAGIDWSGNPAWGVREAVEGFMAELGIPMTDVELGGEYTYYVRKP